MSTTPAPLFTQISTLSRTTRIGTVETHSFAVASNSTQVVVTSVVTLGSHIERVECCVLSREDARHLYAHHLRDGFLPVAP